MLAANLSSVAKAINFGFIMVGACEQTIKG